MHQYYQKPKNVGNGLRISGQMNEKLAKHIMRLVEANSDYRRKRVTMMASIERDLLGVAAPDSQSDCDRAQKRAEGRGASTPDRIYPFGYVAIRRYSSDLSSMIMPPEAPYHVIVDYETQDEVNALSLGLRNQAALFDHRSNINACIYDALTFDLFAHEVQVSTTGTTEPNITGPVDGAMKGLAIRHLDPYNIVYDTSVPEHKVARRGEFVGEVSMINLFQVRLMSAEGEIQMEPEAMKWLEDRITGGTNNGQAGNTRGSHFFADVELNRARYEGDQAFQKESNGINRDHSGLFNGMGAMSTTGEYKNYTPNSLEMLRVQVRLDPSHYTLARPNPANRLAIYEVIMIDRMVVSAKPIENSGGEFPIRVGTMSYNRQLGRHVAAGDSIGDLSSYASNMMNIHKRSRRKGLEGGVTIYNGQVIPLHELDDMHGGRLSTRAMRWDDDIRKHVMQLNDPIDTKAGMQDVASALELMRTLVPENSQPELAGLDRATEYQAMAVALTGDRLMFLDGSLLDGQLMAPARQRLQYLLMTSGITLEYADANTQSKLQSLSPDAIKGMRFRITQPQVFVGIDRLRSTAVLQNITNTLLQVGDQISPIAAEMMKHTILASNTPIDITDYERVIRETQLAARERIAMEQGAPDEGNGPTEPVVG
jgi:hypothetical protein